MKAPHFLLAASITLIASGCFYTSQPTDSPIGTGCKTQTFGLGFISSPTTTCETSAQPPVPDIAPGSGKPMPSGPGSSVESPPAQPPAPSQGQ